MQIDWFTFAAQIVNFLVLVALLRWLLYGPIVRAMRRREEKIQNRLQEAEDAQAKAEAKAREYEEKNRQIERQREQLLDEARQEARQQRERLFEEAREEVDRQRRQWQESLARERDDLIAGLRRDAGKMGVDAARHALAHLADAELEQQMCQAFASRLQTLDQQQRDEIARHLSNGPANVAVRSAFDVPRQRRDPLRKTLQDAFGYDGEITFDRSSDLICGVELEAGGYRFGWNVKDFLQQLEVDFDERLQQAG